MNICMNTQNPSTVGQYQTGQGNMGQQASQYTNANQQQQQQQQPWDPNLSANQAAAALQAGAQQQITNAAQWQQWQAYQQQQAPNQWGQTGAPQADGNSWAAATQQWQNPNATMQIPNASQQLQPQQQQQQPYYNQVLSLCTLMHSDLFRSF